MRSYLKMGGVFGLLTFCYISLFSQFQINGTAFQTGPDCFTLTPPLNGQAGSIFWNNQISLNNNFDLTFEIFLGCSNGGADGAAFVLQPVSNNVGSTGGGLGYAGINPSVAVEFDTWQNNTDPTWDHLAIQANGSTVHVGANNLAGPVGATNALPNIEDCQYHSVRFTWDASTMTFNVYWECVLRLTYTGNLVTNIFNGNPNVYWGFTAATGGAVNEQKFCLGYASFVTPAVDTSLCIGDSVELDAGGAGATYIWTPATGLSNPSVQRPMASPAVTTQYNIQVIDSCGASRFDSLVVTVNPLPSTSIGNDTTICPGNSLVLDAGPGFASYQWQDNSTAQTFSAGTPGQFFVNATDTNGCEAFDTLNLALFPQSQVNLGPDTSICAGNSVIFDAGPGFASYLWQNNSTSQTYLDSLPGQIHVLVQDNNGCTARDTVNLSFRPDLQVNLGNDTSICADANLLLDAGPGFTTYLWQDNSTNQTFSANSGGSKYVTVTDADGCTGSDTLNLTLNPLPVVFLGNDTNICAGEVLLLDAGAGFSAYLWQDNSTGQTLSAAATGLYHVQVTDANGCSGRDSLQLTIHPNPVFSLGNDTSLCPGEQLLLDPGANFVTYVWQDNSVGQTFSAASAGQYSVTVTDANGCSSADTLLLNYYPAPTLDLGPDTNLCAGDVLLLDAGPGWANLLWQDGSGNQTFQAANAGTYSVTATDQNGCQVSDSRAILNVFPLPVISLGNDTVICSNLPLTLNPGAGFALYDWSTGASSATITVSQAGTYSVTVTDQNQCEGSGSIAVLGLDFPPAVDLGPDLELCLGDSVELDAGPGADQYLWQDGASGQTYSASAAGTYSVQVSNRCATVSDEMELTLIFPPQPDLGPDTTFCEDEVVLRAGAGFLTYAWQDGSSQEVLPVFEAGLYWVAVSNSCFTVSDSVEVVEECAPNLFFPTAFTPNGDGLNDEFFASGDPVDDFEMLVFDRWGKLIFYSKNVSDGWNGDFQGRSAQEGVYSWVCRFRFANRAEQFGRSGSVTLLR